MQLSKYLIPVLKEQPKDAQIASHRLMLQTGMIQQSSSGIYSWLPLGLKVLEKIQNIINEEMQLAGAVPILMPTIQPASLWAESGRLDSYGKELLRFKDRHNADMLYGPTNEEQVTEIFKSSVNSYKQLPLNLYQVQWKFRDEVRPRFGVMRGREFLMKDAYSFDLDEKSAKTSFIKMFVAYLRIFERLGLTAIPVKADPGPIGGDLSYEFAILAPNGESEIIIDSAIKKINNKLPYINYEDEKSLFNIFDKYLEIYSATDETHDTNNELYKKALNNDAIETMKAVEVAHIFYFGNKYSKALNAKVLFENKAQEVLMGSYGIGVSRLVGAIIEAKHTAKGMAWPINAAPFEVIVSPLSQDESIMQAAFNIYNELKDNNIDVIINDTNESVGIKLNKADMIGIPYQVNIGKKSIMNNQAEIEEKSINKIHPTLLAETSKWLIDKIKADKQ